MRNLLPSLTLPPGLLQCPPLLERWVPLLSQAENVGVEKKLGIKLERDDCIKGISCLRNSDIAVEKSAWLCSPLVACH